MGLDRQRWFDAEWAELDVRGGWSEGPAVEEKLICLHPFFLLKLSSLPALVFLLLLCPVFPLHVGAIPHAFPGCSHLSHGHLPLTAPSWWLPQRCHQLTSLSSAQPQTYIFPQVGNLEMLTHFSCRVNLVLGTTIQRKFVLFWKSSTVNLDGLPSSRCPTWGPLKAWFDPHPSCHLPLVPVESLAWIFLIQANNGCNEKMKPQVSRVLKKVKFHTAPTMEAVFLAQHSKNESRYTLRFLLSIQPL